MTTASFRKWVAAMVRYVPNGGVYWCGRYNHIRFAERWFAVEVDVCPRSADRFEISPKILFLGGYTTAIEASNDAVDAHEYESFPWRSVPRGEGTHYRTLTQLQWNADDPMVMSLNHAAYGDDPAKIYEE